MSFFSSLWRATKSFFGLAEGGLERATDSMVTSSPDAIRNQFRKTREDWTREYNQMRDAVADLIRIREMRMDEVKKLNTETEQIEVKMAGAIELYKKNNDERFRDAYGQLAAKSEEKKGRVKELLGEVENMQKNLERYKGRLMEFQRQIEGISKEEAETVADIVSSQKIKELNDRLQGLAVDTQSKNLEAIREARQKAKATASLSSELSGADVSDLERQMSVAGAGSKYLDAFDSAIGKKPQATAQPMPELAPSNSTNSSAAQKAQDPVELELQKLLGNK